MIKQSDVWQIDPHEPVWVTDSAGMFLFDCGTRRDPVRGKKLAEQIVREHNAFEGLLVAARAARTAISFSGNPVEFGEVRKKAIAFLDLALTEEDVK